ncbi:DUF982 domain-containing protein (plasmid) [Ensifer adhaerens]|uniref:DUF982 domain-containing protein n=1 Tax=Ensifer adhaerens TaxID=106592 RepID=UPI001CBD4198|nr:DUF982 domain-containing protein [Ensifer adhaerens]MBZ7927631.1 DUF982 domain-containing protein [Ensifer adhaerens]UAX98030.1 DUF982 domain-containing protein [Ensifer adhaerens]UAY05411.1 DUF982 domain-containing protein [Ensifer adhaerens]UAY12789.1 DUF982 domain-containing protein [Ensifer adhaerens]
MHTPEIPWTVPLSVRLQSGSERLFFSVHAALDFLENEWPTRSGRGYEGAVRSCRGALKRATPAAVAREAFVGACLEAGMVPTAIATLRTPERIEKAYT